MEISAKDARNRFSNLLKRVEEGDEVIILRRGKKVARLIPTRNGTRRLPSLKEFRASIRLKGDSLSRVVTTEREGSRY